jgi:stage II sporulation protein GA (sporulation sigma-E factor processing peptidase)
MIVYVDIIFLINFLLNALLLLATAKIYKIRPVLWRVFLSAGIGAGYAIFMFMPTMSFLFTLIVKCLFSAFMIMTAFGYKSFRSWVGIWMTFYAINFISAGSIMAIHYALQSTHEIWNGIIFMQMGAMDYTNKLSLWFVSMASTAGILLYFIFHAGAKRRQLQSSWLATVEVKMAGQQVQCVGLIDTGNQLYEPLTNVPVMVMELRVCESILPEEIRIMVRSHSIQVHDFLKFLQNSEMKLRCIPYRGIHGSTQWMIAMKPDLVHITHHQQHFQQHEVWIGIKAEPFSAEGAYQAIIHPALIYS